MYHKFPPSIFAEKEHNKKGFAALPQNDQYIYFGMAFTFSRTSDLLLYMTSYMLIGKMFGIRHSPLF